MGTFLVAYLLIHKNLLTDYQLIKQEGVLGKLITLGSLLNGITFFILLKKGKDMMAKGIIVAVILLALYTFII
jgi:hypothetical protein